MKNKNGLSYENIVNNLENDKIYVPETREYQALSKEKTKEFVLKCISGALIIVGIGTTAMGCAKKKTKSAQTTTTTAIVAEGEEPESLNYEFVLETPFTNGEEKVIVNDVNKNNKKDDSTSKDLTERMVKFFNGTLTKDDFKGMSDKEIIKEVRYYTVNMFDVLSASIADFKQIQDGVLKSYNEFSEKKLVSLENSYVHKTYGKKYDSILEKQRHDMSTFNGVKGQNMAADNFNSYVALCEKMICDENISHNDKMAIVNIVKRDYEDFFAEYLSEEVELVKNDKESFDRILSVGAKAVAFTLFDKNSYVYKTYLRQYDGSILNEQKSDIVNGNKKDFTINAEAYGELGKKMLSDKNITIYEKALIAKILKADYPLFSRYLSKELKEFYQKEFDSSYFTQAMNTFFNDYAIATDVLDADCDDKTKEGEKYNAADAKDAQSKAGSTGEEGKTTTKKGGKKEGTTSVVISGSKQTGSTQSTTVVNKEKETTKKETVTGGKVVDEQTTNKPPKVIDEEVVEPGKDNVESGTYTEEEWNSKSSSKTETTTKKETTTKQEENSSSDDREFEEILTEDEWLRYLGMGSIGLGGFVGVAPKIKRRKK